MARLIYFAFPRGSVQGGQKMIIRHVEALRGLGFDAYYGTGPHNVVPTWFEHNVVRFTDSNFRSDDVVVLPDDAHDSLRRIPSMGLKAVVFSQGIYLSAALSYEALETFPEGRLPPFIAVGQRLAATIRRAWPGTQVELAPCFADERIFRPGGAKRDAIAYAPRKRPIEANAIRAFLRRFHPRHAGLPWTVLENATELEMADGFRSSTLFLSLSRLESIGITPLEAMACGCVVAGFTGVGGQEFATTANGFWVPEDDCGAAADALAQAADLVATGGPALKWRLEAGYETARQWSYARFLTALEEVWMKLAPETRIQTGPLD
ncbi:glycosyltransferase [Phenylobacterium sp.]|uniref:glycosyltransferase n=1 Tax=Phenylobacterium sp. TaxID=1871053 RepID=UPI002F9318F4